MKSLWATPLSSDRLWEVSFFLIGSYLLFYPPLNYGQSYSVALGGGLILLLFRTITSGSLSILGKAWWAFLLYLLFTASWSLRPGITLQSAGFVFLGSLLYLMVRSNDPKTQSRVEIFGLFLAVVAAILALKQWLFGFEDLNAILPHVSRFEFPLGEKAIFYLRASGPLVAPGSFA